MTARFPDSFGFAELNLESLRESAGTTKAVFDLRAYLDRIGFQGSAQPDLANLHQIILKHSCSIPFEHFDVLSNLGISLAEEDVFQKLVVAKRGGYCFEQNGLILAALREIGFSVSPIGARVRLGTPRDVLPRRTHMFVRVDLHDESWIVDAGFGGYSLTGALRWEFDTMQTTPHESRRLVRDGSRYFHQALIGEEWLDLCEFGDLEMPAPDQDIANWWTSTNPDSRFRTGLSLGLANEDGTRRAILNDRFTHRRGAEIVEQQILEDEAALRKCIRTEFGLRLPESISFGAWPFK